jgi:hypothetical protein
MSIRDIKGKAWLMAWGLALALRTGALRSKPIEIVIPRPCMVEVRLTDKTECHGLDKGHLKCTGFQLTLKPGCEQLKIAR